MSLIAAYLMGEQANSVLYDHSGNEFDGAITGATLGATGPGDGLTAMSFDEVNDDVDLISAGLTSAWPKDQLTIAMWFDIDDWAADIEVLCDFGVDTDNRIVLAKIDLNTFVFDYHENGTNHRITHTMSPAGYEHVAVTLDVAGAAKWIAYVGGTAVDVGLDPVAEMAGALVHALLGRESPGGNFYGGSIARVDISNTALTPAQIASLASISP